MQFEVGQEIVYSGLLGKVKAKILKIFEKEKCLRILPEWAKTEDEYFHITFEDVINNA